MKTFAIRRRRKVVMGEWRTRGRGRPRGRGIWGGGPALSGGLLLALVLVLVVELADLFDVVEDQLRLGQAEGETVVVVLALLERDDHVAFELADRQHADSLGKRCWAYYSRI